MRRNCLLKADRDRRTNTKRKTELVAITTDVEMTPDMAIVLLLGSAVPGFFALRLKPNYS